MFNRKIAEAESGAASERKRRRLYVGAALFALVVALSLVWEAEDSADVRVSQAPEPAPIVTVVNVSPAAAVPAISAFAELRPRWDAKIRAAVSGRIEEVHGAALAGGRVDAGTLLFSVEKTPYVANVAAAELALEQARLALWQAQNAVTVARGQFERAGKEAPNELALRLPELRIAERNVKSAEAQLAAAERRLLETDVRAPFAGIVVERMASLGQTVLAGEALLHLSDDERFEAVVELDETDWSLLRQPIAGSTVKLFHRDGTALGEATVRQGGGFLDPATRQRRIFLDVAANGEQLLAGDFVRVQFTGRPIERALSVPESAMTRTGHVWFVDKNDRLERFAPRVSFRAGAELILPAPPGSGTFRVATTPLAAFLPGQRVEPSNASTARTVRPFEQSLSVATREP